MENADRKDIAHARTATLLDDFASHVSRRPGEVFCYFLRQGSCEAITFGDLARHSAAYANLYRHEGIRRGEVVLIALQHCPDLYYAFLGALMGGFIPSFMPFPSEKQDPVKYWESHRQLFARIGAGAILTYEENVEPLRRNIPEGGLHILLPRLGARENVPSSARLK
jgi:acyl-coenzyme A synthetase/AMP-(fatty) acid ligase